MVLNYLWVCFFAVGFLAALAQWLFTGNADVFKTVVDGTFTSSKMAVMDIALPLAGVMTLWLGFLSVAEKAGAVQAVSRIIGPFFSRIFPEVPKDHPATGHMMMNFSANMLGLDNAATPMGLKAMESLQSINPNKDEASNAQIMFLVLQTSGLTLIPIAIIAQRAILGAANPADVFIPILIATYVATLTALIAVAVRQKINLLDRVIFGWVGGATAALAGFVWYLDQHLTRAEIETFSKIAANVTLLTLIAGLLVGAAIRKVNVYEAFIEGAKGGIQTSLTIIPYLVAMLVAIGVLRNAGVLGLLVSGCDWVLLQLGWPTDFTPALPTALMKPLSGSGARAMMVDAMTTYGADSFVGRLACIFQGATDTTFYIVALYFGSVGVKRTRYAITYGLLADLAGVIAAIFVAYLFFG
ncbi:MAG: spore maturation protein [Opitutaceae bacterium]|jgi:spore maturation protein SpmA|nr:spore maturation protein [Opitutaceae bacterium]